MRPFFLGFAVLLCSTACPGPAPAQQVPDPNFNTKVAQPAYKENGPVVCIDEAHFNFHTVGGRYKPFADLLVSDGYRVQPNKAKFTKESLAECKVLIISNALGAERMNSPEAANPAFTEEECEAVAAWVKEGGSLLLISDHAPMGAAAECLAKRFGVEMHKGHVIDRTHLDKNLNNPGCLAFSRDYKLLGDHPILQGRSAEEQIHKVTTFTGQSLKGPAGSVMLLKLSDEAKDIAADRSQTSAAGRCQGLALVHGKGRVVVLGEAGCLSAQLSGAQKKPMGMNVPGIDNRQLALNIMHWLSGLLE